MGSICCARMVRCVHKCLENASICLLCHHDRDYNDNEDEHGGSSREKDRDQRDRDEREVVLVNFRGKVFLEDSDEEVMEGDLCLWVLLEQFYQAQYRFAGWWSEKSMDICWQCKGHQTKGSRGECWNWYRNSWIHRMVSLKSHLLMIHLRPNTIPMKFGE